MSKTKVQKEKNMTPQPKKNNKTINLIVNFFTKPANVILFIFANKKAQRFRWLRTRNRFLSENKPEHRALRFFQPRTE